jgi:desulfoferrodoxin (superoxide reductase-like protein)
MQRVQSLLLQITPEVCASVVRNEQWEANVSELEQKEGPVLTVKDKLGPPHVTQVTQANGIATLAVHHGCTASHWIGCIYAKDQNGIVIHYEDKPRMAAQKPIVTEFKVPYGVTSFVAFEWCNVDGIYQSDVVTVLQ